MARKTKKVGVCGKYGTRYGASLRKYIKHCEESQHKKHICMFCGKKAITRKATGIWNCQRCKKVISGGAYDYITAGSATVRSYIVWEKQALNIIKKHDFINYQTIKTDFQVTKMYYFDDEKLSTVEQDSSSFIFIVNSDICNIARICELIVKLNKTAFTVEFILVFLPRKCAVCLNKLKNENVVSLFNYIRHVNIYFTHLDDSLFDMNIKDSFQNIYLNEYMNHIYDCFGAFQNFEELFGSIDHIYAKGKYANMMLCMIKDRENKQDTKRSQYNQFHNCFIVDRTIDIFTLMLKQQSYEGLIDEIFTIEEAKNGNIIEFESNVNISFDYTDELYSEIRYKNIPTVGKEISKKNRYLIGQYAENAVDKSSDIAHMKKVVEKLPEIQRLKAIIAHHISLAESLLKYINNIDVAERFDYEKNFIMETMTFEEFYDYFENCVYCKGDIIDIIRLVELYSYMCGGLSGKQFEVISKTLIQVYGFGYLPLISNCKKVGIFSNLLINTSFAQLKRNLNHISVNLSDKGKEQLINYDDITNMYNGWIPTITKLTEHLIISGWEKLENLLKHFSGPSSSLFRKNINMSIAAYNKESVSDSYLVFVIGGLTYSEISSLRLLNVLYEGKFKIHVITTEIICGNTFIKSLNNSMDYLNLIWKGKLIYVDSNSTIHLLEINFSYYKLDINLPCQRKTIKPSMDHLKIVFIRGNPTKLLYPTTSNDEICGVDKYK
ncbi:hypothetical protein A3Q56_00011 [Intoshia linei]|uniref:60S ribosomal protein L37a n=1 Tax=Intoshia linei TaxID=1819745 RepID=A0A177BDE8_9BILA|nr:hypothetical protein A3Q56_00011 [Intoshia linei]